jgi:hypothetical protein
VPDADVVLGCWLADIALGQQEMGGTDLVFGKESIADTGDQHHSHQKRNQGLDCHLERSSPLSPLYKVCGVRGTWCYLMKLVSNSTMLLYPARRYERSR